MYSGSKGRQTTLGPRGAAGHGTPALRRIQCPCAIAGLNHKPNPTTSSWFLDSCVCMGLPILLFTKQGLGSSPKTRHELYLGLLATVVWGFGNTPARHLKLGGDHASLRQEPLKSQNLKYTNSQRSKSRIASLEMAQDRTCTRILSLCC